MKEVTKKMLEKLPHRSQVMFALLCAKQVKAIWKDVPEAKKAIEVVERWLAGKATSEECKEAAKTAYAVYAVEAATDAAYYTTKVAANTVDATYAAANAVYAAGDAAKAAAKAGDNKNAIIKAQWEYYDDLMALVDGRVDKILVGEA